MQYNHTQPGSGAVGNLPRILITGAAGYVGSTLIKGLLDDERVRHVVGVDVKPRPESLGHSDRLSWVESNVTSGDWHPVLTQLSIDVVIHLAFWIKPARGAREAARCEENVRGAISVIEGIKRAPSVRQLIHFSTVSAYGALPHNSAFEAIREDHPLKEREYTYGRVKAVIESELRSRVLEMRPGFALTILRCASISGPRGRELRRYGLLSTITGSMPIIPCGSRGFGRNYLHEHDLVNAVAILIREPNSEGMRVFNLAGPGYVDVSMMASVLRKRVCLLPAWLIRILFSISWWTSLGRVPTPPGAWRFLTYPLPVDGGKFERTFSFRYQNDSLSTFAELARAGPECTP